MSACPRCATACEQREGPYFVCAACRWRWTVSVTGQVYVQGAWPGSPADDDEQAVHHLLQSVENLPDKLAGAWPASPLAEPAQDMLRRAGLTRAQIERLRIARAAAQAGYYSEGVPLDQLRAEGIRPPNPPDAAG